MTQKKYKIKVNSKKEFNKLINEYREKGFMWVTLGKRVAELETETEFVFIEY